MEVLLVIVVAAILAGIFFPLAGRVVQRSQEARCLSNLRQIGLAVFLYAGEHRSQLPPGQEEGIMWFNLKTSWLGKYGRATSLDKAPLLRCPLDKTASPVADYQFYYSYGWNSHFLQVHANGLPPYGRSFARLSEAGGKILFADGLSHAEDPANVAKYPSALAVKNVAQRLSRRHRGGVQALFGDGRVVWLGREEAARAVLWERELDAI
ncbi:MAG TPA: H-X9-DG-CTERM domain-containing protein [Chthoniobacteraceae bacterium]|nr:H-X9-DG-CTERM domain-containing protein [Chthoniobacteraceae bacterium]